MSEPTSGGIGNELLVLQVWETDDGWACVVYEGDRGTPGSVHRAEYCHPNFNSALIAGASRMKQSLKERACDHVWEKWEGKIDPSWGDTSHFMVCDKCGLMDTGSFDTTIWTKKEK